jgi:MFS family permease
MQQKEPIMSAPSDRMSPEERRAGASLAAIFALRMLGLFLILPVFSVYAKTLPGGDNLALVGFALGAYGLTQALFQIPYGIASDIYGRKLVIVIGLVIFAIGSFVAAWAPTMNWIIVGRVLQGAGAISAAVTALAADLTREEHRTKVMAMIGSSIGLVFALSLVGAPLLYGLIGMGGLFSMTGVLALAAIVLLIKAVPPAPPPHGHAKLPLRQVVLDPDLMRLNVGIFLLHMVQMAMFVVLPHALVDHGGLDAAAHWKVYLPAVLVSFAVMVPAIIAAERKDKMRPIFWRRLVCWLLFSPACCYSTKVYGRWASGYCFSSSPSMCWKQRCLRWFRALRIRRPRVLRLAFITPRRHSACSSAAHLAVISPKISAIMRFLPPAPASCWSGWSWQTQ